MPSAASACSTLTWVAMPAWSVPKIHLVGRPDMRATRISRSWIAALSAWPMCNAPVTLGGGTAIEKLPSAPSAASGLKIPALSQRSNTRPSTSAGA